jgi:hypothetical protein
VFVHIRAVERAGMTTLNEGQRLSFDVVKDPKKGKTNPQKSEGRLVADHRFRAGQRVTLAANVINRRAVGGSYVVISQLPERDGEFEYRIKNAYEPDERVARENELAGE